MNALMADVTIHIDEETSPEERERLEDALRAVDGVMAASSHEDRPHLIVVEFDSSEVSSQQVLETVTAFGVHAELVGL